jgi:ELWxxDGT repeat protein
MNVRRVLMAVARQARRLAPVLLIPFCAQAQNQLYIPYNLSDVTWLGSVQLFAAYDDQHGVELWRSDATTGGNTLVADIFPGTTGSFPRNFVNLNGAAFFSANDGVHGTELWTSDGTAAGTQLIADIAGGPAGSNPENLTVVEGQIFFAANDGVNGTELWCTDGTIEGTRRVSDINPGAGSSSPQQLIAYNGFVYFFATDGTGVPALWRSNGTSVGTVLVSRLGGSTPLQLSALGSELLILAYDPVIGYEYWNSNGSTPGTYPVVNSPTAAVTIAWSPVTQTTTGTALTNLSGYNIYYGPSPIALTSSINVADPTATSTVVPNLTPGTLYFAVTAYVTGGLESDLSSIVAVPLTLSP